MTSPSPFAQLWSRPGEAGLLIDDSGNLTPLDRAFLGRALEEAWHGVGRTAPNPPVGAVITRGEQILATGFHAKAGERHAEVVALDAVAGQARGATLYVTLEPCAHHGKTPPCAERVIAEGIARVVVGSVDPNPQVHEQGIGALRAAGIVVDVAHGPLAARCRALIEPFARTLAAQRPWVIWKVAASLDGRVAAPGGKSRWITGELARRRVHGLRNLVDAIMVGAGTVVADNPALTARIDGGRDPRRIVIDGNLRTEPTAEVYRQGAGQAPLVVHGRAHGTRQDVFDAAGIARLDCAGAGGRVDLELAVAALAPTTLALLVEAGPRLAGALWSRNLIDEIWWMTAPLILGHDGIPAVGPLGLESPADAERWIPIHREALDDDTFIALRHRETPGASV